MSSSRVNSKLQFNFNVLSSTILSSTILSSTIPSQGQLNNNTFQTACLKYCEKNCVQNQPKTCDHFCNEFARLSEKMNEKEVKFIISYHNNKAK